MKKSMIIAIIVIILVVAGLFIYSNRNNEDNSNGDIEKSPSEIVGVSQEDINSLDSDADGLSSDDFEDSALDDLG